MPSPERARLLTPLLVRLCSPQNAATARPAIASACATWNPNNPTITVKEYQSVITQAWVGVLVNSIGKCAPDLNKKFGRHKDELKD
jgi:hypothetical protein